MGSHVGPPIPCTPLPGFPGPPFLPLHVTASTHMSTNRCPARHCLRFRDDPTLLCTWVPISTLPSPAHHVTTTTTTTTTANESESYRVRRDVRVQRESILQPVTVRRSPSRVSATQKICRLSFLVSEIVLFKITVSKQEAGLLMEQTHSSRHISLSPLKFVNVSLTRPTATTFSSVCPHLLYSHLPESSCRCRCHILPGRYSNR